MLYDDDADAVRRVLLSAGAMVPGMMYASCFHVKNECVLLCDVPYVVHLHAVNVIDCKDYALSSSGGNPDRHKRVVDFRGNDCICEY